MTSTNSNKKSKNKQTLPWWVELLFVQLGLPDGLLRSFLKTRKETKDFYLRNSQTITKYFLLVFSLIYLYPLTRQAYNQNQCIQSAINIAIQNKDIIRNNGKKTFLLKWKMTVEFFTKYYLSRGKVYNGPLNEPDKNFFYYKDYLISKTKFYFKRMF